MKKDLLLLGERSFVFEKASFVNIVRATILFTSFTAGMGPEIFTAKEGRKMNAKTKKILGVCLVAVLIAALVLAYAAFREKPVEGSKAVTIEVVNSQGTSTTYDLKTDAQFLQGAMEEADGLTFSGTEGPYGMMVDTVNGEKADYNVDGAYWSFYVNGEYCNYGIDSQPVEDGDAFSIVYSK